MQNIPRPRAARTRRRRFSRRSRYSSFEASAPARIAFREMIPPLTVGPDPVSSGFYPLNPAFWTKAGIAMTAKSYTSFGIEGLRLEYKASCATTATGSLQVGVVQFQNTSLAPESIARANGAINTPIFKDSSSVVDVALLVTGKTLPLTDVIRSPVIVWTFTSSTGNGSTIGNLFVEGTFVFVTPSVTNYRFGVRRDLKIEDLALATDAVPTAALVTKAEPAAVSRYVNAARRTGQSNTSFLSSLFSVGKKLLCSLDPTGTVKVICDGVEHLLHPATLGMYLNLKTAADDNDIEVTSLDVTPVSNDPQPVETKDFTITWKSPPGSLHTDMVNPGDFFVRPNGQFGYASRGFSSSVKLWAWALDKANAEPYLLETNYELPNGPSMPGFTYDAKDLLTDPVFHNKFMLIFGPLGLPADFFTYPDSEISPIDLETGLLVGDSDAALVSVPVCLTTLPSASQVGLDIYDDSQDPDEPLYACYVGSPDMVSTAKYTTTVFEINCPIAVIPLPTTRDLVKPQSFMVLGSHLTGGSSNMVKYMTLDRWKAALVGAVWDSIPQSA